MCFTSNDYDDRNNYAYRPVNPPQQPPGQPPLYASGRQAQAQQFYDPWQGPPGYVSPEAGRWRGPLGRKKYEDDVYRYGIVEADIRAKKRRRRGAAAAIAGGAGA
jgi:hypothetical protein